MASSVRPLQKDDDRTSFRSGDADLDHFFHRYAGQNQFRHRAGVTYVYEHEARIVAYMTVTAWTMESREMGCVGISTDAKRDAVDYYAARGLVFFDTVEDQGAPPDAEKEMFLSLRKMETALGE